MPKLSHLKLHGLLLFAAATSIARADKACVLPNASEYDFSAEIAEWFPSPVEFTLDQRDDKSVLIVSSQRSAAKEKYETGKAAVSARMPKGKQNGVAALFGKAESASERACREVTGNWLHFAPLVRGFEATAAKSTKGGFSEKKQLTGTTCKPDQDYNDLCTVGLSAADLMPRQSEGWFNAATPLCPVEVIDVLPCADKQREAALRIFYSQLVDSWIATYSAANAQRQDAQRLLDIKLQAEAEEQQRQANALADEARSKEDAQKRLQAKRAAEREAAHRADLIAGRIPVKTCNDAAIKFGAEDGHSVALLGGGDTKRYYGFSNYLVMDTQRRENDRVYLLGIGGLSVAFRMGPGAVDQYAGGPLPVCAVGRFSGYADLKDGGKIAKFDGVYLGR